MKKYHLFFMCSVLLSPCHFVFGMEESSSQRELILKVLKQKDQLGVLLPPDEFYTPEMFQRTLTLPQQKLRDHLEAYNKEVTRRIEAAIKRCRENNSDRLENYPPPSPSEVLTFLHAPFDKPTVSSKAKPPWELFQQLKDGFWIVQKMACLDTGADLSHPMIDPTKTPTIVSASVIQMIKENVKRQLEQASKK